LVTAGYAGFVAVLTGVAVCKGLNLLSGILEPFKVVGILVIAVQMVPFFYLAAKTQYALKDVIVFSKKNVVGSHEIDRFVLGLLTGSFLMEPQTPWYKAIFGFVLLVVAALLSMQYWIGKPGTGQIKWFDRLLLRAVGLRA